MKQDSEYRPPSLWRRALDSAGVSYLFILPAVAIYVGVILRPDFLGMDYAFTNWNGLSHDYDYVGLANFTRMFDDVQLRSAISTTLIIAAALVAVKIPLGLLLALGVNSNLKTRNYLRLAFFLPVVLTPIIISYLWKYIFSNDGTLNTLLNLVGLDGLRWLGDPTLALISVVIVTAWQALGLYMIIFIAGLQGIPPEINEAAMIDGAGAVRRVWSVTLPMLAPSVTVCVVIALIQGLRFFDQIFALTHGGPGYATETLSTMIYRITFQFGEFSYGAAVALVFSIIVAVIVLPLMHVLRKREIAHG